MACPPQLFPTVLFCVDAENISLSQCAETQQDVVVIHTKRTDIKAWSSHNQEMQLAPPIEVNVCDFANLWLPNAQQCSFGNLAPNALLRFRTKCGKQMCIGLTITGVTARCPDFKDRLTMVARLADPSNPPWGVSGCERFVCGCDATLFVDGAALDPTLLPQV